MFAAAPWKPTTPSLHWRDGLALSPSFPPIIALLLSTIVIIWGIFSGIVYSRLFEINGIYFTIILINLFGFILKKSSIKLLQLLGQGLIVTSFFMLISLATMLASAVLARVSAPLADHFLVNLDKSLFGFDWRTAVLWVGKSKIIGTFLIYVYISLSWQPEFLFIYLCLMDNCARA